jgi:hypothetical protein
MSSTKQFPFYSDTAPESQVVEWLAEVLYPKEYRKGGYDRSKAKNCIRCRISKELKLFLGLIFAHGAKNGRHFVLAQQAAKTFKMSIHALGSAQSGLEAKGFIEVLQRGGACEKTSHDCSFS